MTELKNTVIETDFVQKKTGKRWEVENEKGVPRFLRDLARICKEEQVKSVMVITIDPHNHIDWVNLIDSEHDAALIALSLPDAVDDLKSEIFNEYLDEE